MTPGDGAVRIDDAVVDAMASLGNEQRLEILLALARAERERRAQGYSMSFTELYEAVDIGSSSQFSYHLERLVGEFVVETTDGYRLTDSGGKIVRAIRSGLYEGPPAFEDRELSGACVICEKPTLLATLTDGLFVVRCGECESTLLTDSFPRSQARNRTPAEIVSSFGYRIWGSALRLRGGVCPECFGRVETVADTFDHEGTQFHGHVSTCRECGLVITFPIEVTAAFHPSTIGFLWNHGISLLDTPLWTFFEWIATGLVTSEVASLEPFDATVTFAVDGDALRLETDGAGTVTPIATDD